MGAPGGVAIEARVLGRVQGVWFRGWTRQEATRLGLTGWVRNEPDGSVLARFQGGRDAVAEMLALCREGPHMASVEDVLSREVAYDADLTGFREIR